jgi:hypothetical protein
MNQITFIIDCPWCKAKVAASQEGKASNTGFDGENDEPYGTRLVVGTCPSCKLLLAGVSHQVDFKGFNSDEDGWSDIARVYPKPPKEFQSFRIPNVATISLIEADRSLQANANIAACVMLGRALEAVCLDILETDATILPTTSMPTPKKKIMLGEGIKILKEKRIIDDRLYDWSQELHAFRNLAAHPTEISISREDAEDLQSFVYAIIDYIYDLTDRYNEFKARMKKRAQKKQTSDGMVDDL